MKWYAEKALMLILVLMLAACASSGQKMSESDLQALEAGKTTLSDMKTRFGDPMSQTLDTDGNLVVNWSYIHVGYMNIGSEQQMLTALFDEDKVLQKYQVAKGSGPGTRLGY